MDIRSEEGASGGRYAAEVEGHEAGSVFSYSAASGLLTAALAHAASQATAQFKEPAFQTLLPPP
jgi:hypothetical protein